MKVQEFSDLQKDILKEISNIGAGNAATSFAKMVGHKIDMRVPQIEIAELKDVPALIGGAETPVVGVLFRVESELASNLLFILDMCSARRLLSLFLGGESQVEGTMSELEISTLKEIGNILSSSYMGALSALTNLSFRLSVPALAVDMAGAVLNVALIPMSEVGNHVLLIRNVFLDGAELVSGYFFLLPDPKTYSAIFEAIGF